MALPFSNERDYHIPGPSIIKVKGSTSNLGLTGLSIPGQEASTATEPILKTAVELGLCTHDIEIKPRFIHKDVVADDFGPEVAADLMWLLADVSLTMQLIHYDDQVLDALVHEASGRSETLGRVGRGYIAGAGTLMGSIFPPFDPKSRYVVLFIQPSTSSEELPYRFIKATLADRPFVMPYGVDSKKVQLQWRVIPSKRNRPDENTFFGPMKILQNPTNGAFATLQPPQFQEITSNGALLWDHKDINDIISD